jgi:uncharacterized protein with HEPN domain
VERKFEVIGEALNQLARVDSTLTERIPDVAQIVAFRNQLIHGYAKVNPVTVWNIVHGALPGLLTTVQALLDAHPPREPACSPPPPAPPPGTQAPCSHASSSP